MRDASVREGKPGWFASFLGAAVLIAGGFGLGLVAGVVSEEPELVVGHLVGRSEEVAWLPWPEAELAPADGEGVVLETEMVRVGELNRPAEPEPVLPAAGTSTAVTARCPRQSCERAIPSRWERLRTAVRRRMCVSCSGARASIPT